MAASGRLRVKLAFYVGLFIGAFGGGRVYTGSPFPSGADLLGLYLATMATPLIRGAVLALMAGLTTPVWP